MVTGSCLICVLRIFRACQTGLYAQKVLRIIRKANTALSWCGQNARNILQSICKRCGQGAKQRCGRIARWAQIAKGAVQSQRHCPQNAKGIWCGQNANENLSEGYSDLVREAFILESINRSYGQDRWLYHAHLVSGISRLSPCR